jgi:glycosyltransferase involved in cell wall biosynthesis
MAEPKPTGIGSYTKNLLNALSVHPEIQLTQLYRFSRRKGKAQLLPDIPQQLWQQNIWPLLKSYDMVHCPDHRLPNWPIKKVVTVHDVYSAVGINFEDPIARDKQNNIYQDFANRADFIIFVSQKSKQDFLRFFSYPESKTQVIPLGVTNLFSPQNKGHNAFGRPYFLMLSKLDPNKNVFRTLQAFAASSLKQDYLLVLAGWLPADQTSALHTLVKNLGLEKCVHFTGYLPCLDIPALYANASGLLFASTYEGFGLPILEAMRSGIPVLTSTGGSCPEVAGGHALLADPYDLESLRQGMEALPSVSAEALQAAQAYATGFTWQRCAQATIRVYQQVKQG